MEVLLIDKELLSELYQKAAENERLRVNFDFRTTAEDSLQSILNVMEVGTQYTDT